MSIVNFAVTKPLERKINQTIKRQGFTSKAEFFRFVTLFYVRQQSADAAAEERFNAAVDDLKEAVRRKIRGKKLPSLREQLADLM